ENVRGYREGRAKKDALNAALRTLNARADAAKTRVFDDALRALDGKLAAYAKGELDVLRYIRALTEGEVPDARFPNARKLLQALDMETSLDFKAVEKERGRFVQDLAAKLDKAALDDLVQASLLYRMGRLGYGAYYDYLRKIAL